MYSFKIRELASDLRNNQLEVLEVVKLSRAAANHVIDVLIPVIADAIKAQVCVYF